MAKSIPRTTTHKSKSITKTTIKNFQVQISRKILKVKVYTPICKPLNGSLPSSKISHMLKLSPFNYQYTSGKETKTKTTTAYMIKGLRGVLRHQVMANCKEHGLEVCHTSDKETTRQGKSLISEGFHLAGSCLEKNECIVHAVFGSKGNKSKIRVSSLPIANISHKTFQTDFRFNNVHISTENRVALTYEGETIQDFSERYFSGEFEFEIDVSECTAEETGMIIEGVMYMYRLGRGHNTGYGELKIKKMKLVKMVTIREPKISGKEEFTIKEHVREEAIPGEFTEALTAWKKCLKGIKAKNKGE